MKLAKNGRALSGKRTRHINIRYFFVTNRIHSNEVRVEYCPTEVLVADFYTKPLQGTLFRQFRNFILNIEDSQCDSLNYFNNVRNKMSTQDDDTSSVSQECVERKGNQTKIEKKNVSVNLKRRTKSRSYAEVCTGTRCEKGETKYIVGKYRPLLLTKLRG